MDRFVSNTINRVDKKGRVSIPAAFRLVLGNQPVLSTILSVEHPVAEAGGKDFMDSNLKRLSMMDPFSEEYAMWSLCLVGDADELKIDPEGRIAISDNIRDHTGIGDEVAFVGCGHFFQLWEPSAFRAYRETARAKVREMRRALGQHGAGPSPGFSTQSQNSPASRTGSQAEPGASGAQGSGKEQDT
ncbi:MAG: hypothetical protein KDJ69_12830 [Nitratireductor sp.]|nr:hypothetical protein [Nitratireductor sp.]